MPTIQLTNNTTLNIAAASADANATLNRYLSQPLSFLTPAGFETIAATTVGEVDPDAFPVTAGATAEGKFPVEGTTLDVQPGASASIGLLTADNASDFFSSLQWTPDPALPDVVSFGLKGTLSVAPQATPGNFSFGLTTAATVTLTSFCAAAPTEPFANTLQRAIVALTIPHDLGDLSSLPANSVCQIEGLSSLKFSASVTYNFLNDPLATVSIPNLPAIAVNAKAGATLEAAATHTSDHTVTVAKLPSGLVHLGVSLKRTDDFETSLTVSAGVTAKVGGQDALEFLLDKISPNSTAELKKIKADLPAAQFEQLNTDIKATIDATLCSSLGASLKAALDDSHSTNRVFLYEIDLAAAGQNADSAAALQSALRGDFTTITSPKPLAGIRQLNSALTDTSSVKHSLALHLLGIFNASSITQFVEKTKVGYTKDTREIVLSDEAIEVVNNNLDAEKLRQVVVKGITLTLPASANTPLAKTPMNMVFFDRQAGTSPSKMRQFANVLNAIGAPSAADANSLLARNLRDYGTTSLYLGLNLTPAQCKQLYIDPATGFFNDWTVYLGAACDGAATILAGDKDNAERLKLFKAGTQFWKDLRDQGASPNQLRFLADHGIHLLSTTDVDTFVWWSKDMEAYATALADGKSPVGAGIAMVQDATRGFDEPWLILATWNLLQKPTIDSLFTSTLLK
jgi:hypothetical protein